MGNDTQNASIHAEDLAIERAEQGFSNPAADNMQFLQSTLDATVLESAGASSSYFNAPSKSSATIPNNFGNSFPGLSPAYSGAGLLGAVAATDMAGLTSAMGMTAQVATAAPVVFGKNTVSDSSVLSSLSGKATSTIDPLNLQDNPLVSKAAVDTSTWPNSIEADSLLAGFSGLPDALDANAELMNLIAGLGQNASPENVQAAIDAISDQIALLNTTFAPIFEGFSESVQGQIASQDGLSSTDLGVSIFDDAGSVSNTLTDLIGSIDVANNPQLGSLLNLDSNFDNISSLIGSLPDLDLTPVSSPIADIVDVITDPITDIVGGITDPVTDIVGGITDPVTDIVGGITDPITDIVGGITDPVTDIVGGITDPVTDIVGGITDPVTDIVGGITDPVTDIVGGITDPVTDIVGGITDPVTDIVGGITDPVTDIVGGITDPVTDIVGGITDPVTDIVGGITDPVTDIVGGITEPVTDIVGGITDPVTDIVDGLLPDLGLLSGLSTSGDGSDGSDLLDLSNSGISSNAGSEGGALGGLLGVLDLNK